MYLRQKWITNSSSSSFVIVTKDSSVTPEFLRRVGFHDFDYTYYLNYKDMSKSSVGITVEAMAKEMQFTDWQLEHPDDYAITAEQIGEIIEELQHIIPETVCMAEPAGSARFYDRYADEETIDMWATYQKLLALGYNVFHYESCDEGGGPDIHVAMDAIVNKTYVSEETKEFITKTSHH